MKAEAEEEDKNTVAEKRKFKAGAAWMKKERSQIVHLITSDSSGSSDNTRLDQTEALVNLASYFFPSVLFILPILFLSLFPFLFLILFSFSFLIIVFCLERGGGKNMEEEVCVGEKGEERRRRRRSEKRGGRG